MIDDGQIPVSPATRPQKLANLDRGHGYVRRAVGWVGSVLALLAALAVLGVPIYGAFADWGPVAWVADAQAWLLGGRHYPVLSFCGGLLISISPVLIWIAIFEKPTTEATALAAMVEPGYAWPEEGVVLGPLVPGAAQLTAYANGILLTTERGSIHCPWSLFAAEGVPLVGDGEMTLPVNAFVAEDLRIVAGGTSAGNGPVDSECVRMKGPGQLWLRASYPGSPNELAEGLRRIASLQPQ